MVVKEEVVVYLEWLRRKLIRESFDIATEYEKAGDEEIRIRRELKRITTAQDENRSRVNHVEHILRTEFDWTGPMLDRQDPKPPQGP